MYKNRWLLPGITVTLTGEKLYGEVLWDPLRLIDKWDNRAAAFFASFSFALSTIGTNISANSLSAANDMTVLLPQYINIRRGQVICALIGSWVLCPWEILASAPGFLSFMAGYTVFLGPFTGMWVYLPGMLRTICWLRHSNFRMIADVSCHIYFILRFSLPLVLDCASRQSWYTSYVRSKRPVSILERNCKRRSLEFTEIDLTESAELASSRNPPVFDPTDAPRFNQQYQSIHIYRKCSIPLRYFLAFWSMRYYCGPCKLFSYISSASRLS